MSVNGDLCSHLDDSSLSSTPNSRKLYSENIENISLPQEFDDLGNVSGFTQDKSHLSDLTREVSEEENTFNCTDYLTKEIDEALKAKRLLDRNLETQIDTYKNLLKEVASARKKYNRSQFVVNTLEEVFENSPKLPADLKKKCSLFVRVSSFIKNIQNSELSDVFEDIEQEPIKLTKFEKQSIHSALKEALEKKIAKKKTDNELFFDLYQKFTKDDTMSCSTITEENIRIISHVREIGELIVVCFDGASKILSTIEKLTDYRCQKFYKRLESEIVHLINEVDLLKLKLKNLNLKIEDTMTQENDQLMEALDVLLEKLKTLFDETEYSLQKTEEVKESYDQLKGTKFEEVLKEYLEIRENMKHKQWALKQMQNSE